MVETKMPIEMPLEWEYVLNSLLKTKTNNKISLL